MERNLFTIFKLTEHLPSPPLKNAAIVIVDPVSTGRVLASKAIDRGHNVIAVWTEGSITCQSLLGECDALPFVAQISETDHCNAEEVVAKIQALHYDVIACTVGCESGVELCDILSHRLNVRSNGEDLSEPRRDKWLMAERIRECGVRAVKQAVVTSVEEATAFITENCLSKWIIKPRRSAASDGVFLCNSLEETRKAFAEILDRKTIFGEANSDALVQEYLAGTEYVVDTVSCDGKHKVVALWEYAKTNIHGSPFVYHDMHLYETDDEKREEALTQYVFSCLDALCVQWGPCHAEVMWLRDEDAPCLVEVGTRPHGAGGNFPELTDPTIGYNQLDVTLDVLLDPPSFECIPYRPNRHTGHAIQYFFVTYEDGILEDVNLAPLEDFKSCVGVDMHQKIGNQVIKTVDLVGATGVVRLVHKDKSIVLRENELLRTMERNLFVISKQVECVLTNPLPSNSAIIVVDPVSTGRVLASKAIDRGYNVIALFTEGAIACQSIVGECDALRFVAQISQMQGENAQDLLKKIHSLPYEIVACTVGCESGVEINDIISYHLGLRSNGTEHSACRRDKWQMTERIRNCGVRAMKQAVVTTLEEATAFIQMHNLTKWILKPRRSAGSDGVFLCTNTQETSHAFAEIFGRRTIFGEANADVLIQEYLVGREYVIDTVSCNGKHKAVAIWEYSKALVNDSPFVYHDMHLYQTDDQRREQILSEYVFSCLDALNVKWGPCHAEAIWIEAEDGPCLVEVGTRPHGAGGNFPALTDPTIGYNQLDVTLDALLDPQSFEKLPLWPKRHQGHAIQYFFVTYLEGVLKSFDLSLLNTFRSCIGIDMHQKIGQRIPKTVDLVTATGVVRLVHSDKKVVEKENQILREKERSLFVITADD